MMCDIYISYIFLKKQTAGPPRRFQAGRRFKYFVIADPSVKNFLQKDGSLLVQLEKALHGLPEAGKLWHELLRDNLTACG